jgi:PTS system nitrogen regulatory IIA component
MNISQLIDEDHVLCCPEVSSKKRLLEVVSELLAVNLNHISTHEIFDSLINREKLGSTGLGKGVAIPHGRIGALEQPVCAFIRLEEPVEFDATDGQPVEAAYATAGTGTAWSSCCSTAGMCNKFLHEHLARHTDSV